MTKLEDFSDSFPLDASIKPLVMFEHLKSHPQITQDENFVVKQLRGEEWEIKRNLKICDMLSKITDKRHTPKFCGYNCDNGEYYVKMSKEGKSLHTLENLKLEEKLNYIREAHNVLEWFHSLGYVHLDVKLDNFVLSSDSNSLLIIDFGLSRKVGDKVKRGFGLPEFEKSDGKCAFQNDTYQFATQFILPFIGKAKFRFRTSDCVKVFLGEEVVKELSNCFVDMLVGMTCSNVEKRGEFDGNLCKIC